MYLSGHNTMNSDAGSRRFFPRGDFDEARFCKKCFPKRLTHAVCYLLSLTGGDAGKFITDVQKWFTDGGVEDSGNERRVENQCRLAPMSRMRENVIEGEGRGVTFALFRALATSAIAPTAVSTFPHSSSYCVPANASCRRLQIYA